MKSAPFKWVTLGDVLITCATGPVPDDVFSLFLDELKRTHATKCLASVVGSAELTSVQRRASAEIGKQKSLMTAVVTDEKLVRGMVTAVSWLGVNIKSFSWNEIPAACTYLKIDPTMVDEVMETIIDLKNSVRIISKGSKS